MLSFGGLRTFLPNFEYQNASRQGTSLLCVWSQHDWWRALHKDAFDGYKDYSKDGLDGNDDYSKEKLNFNEDYSKDELDGDKYYSYGNKMHKGDESNAEESNGVAFDGHHIDKNDDNIEEHFIGSGKYISITKKTKQGSNYWGRGSLLGNLEKQLC